MTGPPSPRRSPGSGRTGSSPSNSVVVGIAGLRAITREIDLPYVPDSEVDSAVRFQSEEVIPFPPDQTVLSSQILTDYTTPEGDKMRRVLVAAAHLDLVDGVIAVVQDAGLTVVGVDLVSSALVRALSDGSGRRPARGHRLHRRRPHRGGHPPAGPAPVRPDHRFGWQRHHRRHRRRPRPPAGRRRGARSAGIGEPTPQVQSAERAAQPSINELAGEIRNSIQYFASLPGRLPGLAGAGDRWWLLPLRPDPHARGPDPPARAARVPPGPARRLQGGDDSGADEPGRRRPLDARSAWPSPSPTRTPRSSTSCRPRPSSGPSSRSSRNAP